MDPADESTSDVTDTTTAHGHFVTPVPSIYTPADTNDGDAQPTHTAASATGPGGGDTLPPILDQESDAADDSTAEGYPPEPEVNDINEQSGEQSAAEGGEGDIGGDESRITAIER
jgi:hypothetical protein